MNQDLSVIVLAAGKGTRMKSEKAKVLHEVFYAPMLQHVLNSVNSLAPQETVVVVGHQSDKVKDQLTAYNVTFAEQTEQLGTGHAVLAAENELAGLSGTVMILCGDTPLIRPSMLTDLLQHHVDHLAQVTLLTTKLDNPANYGRIISDDDGNILAIVEHKDANPEELLIQEINAGIYCVDKDFLFASLKNVGTNNSQGEVYLTDIVKLAVEEGLKVKTFVTPDSIDVLGVNSRLELSQAQTELQLRRNKELMTLGISMINPETIRISSDSTILADCVIEPCVHIHGASNIGHTTVIEQCAVLKNCSVGDGAIIGAHSYLTNTTVSNGQIIPPHTTIL
ncbi:MAG: bifunctional UDP-N-acetylglucosamine pyrophosphorylase/glucosamine-1-phosphate N-acetyltransferase [Desulforhopalus sp.]|jgi:bifunctional UDP-N-acetylglucosamine pyrophosphorylase/glucosamine-1-phosphate N-acetyltransferase